MVNPAGLQSGLLRLVSTAELGMGWFVLGFS